MSNAENSAALRARLGALKIDAASNVLGYALDAWAKEAKMEDPFPSPSAGAQMFNMIRKGGTIGEKSFERIDPFLTMLAGVKNPERTVEELARRNGHTRMVGVSNGNVPDLHEEEEPEEQELTIFHIDENMREILQPIVQRYEVAQALVDEQQAILDVKKKEASTLLNMLKAAGVVERQKYTPKKARETKPERKKASYHISDKRTMEILEQIRVYVADGHALPLPDVPGSFTRPEIGRAFGISSSIMASAVEKLRDQGHIRQAGVTLSGKSNQKTTVYALIP